MATVLPWTQYTEAVVGLNHPTLTDTDNRSLRAVLSRSSLGPDAVFYGFPIGGTAVNVGSSDFTQGTAAGRVSAAVAVAVGAGKTVCWIPQFAWDGLALLPFDASLVTFNNTVRMVREGGRSWNIIDVKAYGAAGDGVTDDTQAFVAAFAAAAANVQYYGTTNVGTPLVIVPEVSSPSGQTKSYLLTSALAIPQGLRMEGEGLFAPTLRFIVSGNNSTLFTFFGDVEAKPAQIIMRNLLVFQAGTALTSIAFRIRNFDWVRLDHVLISNFRVGVWADWGQDIELRNCEITGCTRATQWGGNIAQGESPTPPAGLRSGGGGSSYCDHITLTTNLFSQNQIDVNDMGSTKADGNLYVVNNTFFESPASPVAGKFRFLTIANRQALTFLGNTIESPNNSRTGLFFGQFDYDGNNQGVPYGAFVAGNHFFNNAGTTAYGIDVTRAGGVSIQANLFKVGSGGTSYGVILRDTIEPAYVGPNYWIDMAGTVETPRTTPSISIAGAPASGHVLGQGSGSAYTPVGANRVTVTDAATVAIDASSGTLFWLLTTAGIGATRAIGAPTNPAAQRIVLTVIQDGVGGRAVTWNAVFKQSWSDVGNTANKRSSIAFVYDGTNWNQDGAQTPYV